MSAMISFPKRLPRGVVRDQAVIAADFFPTNLELCGVPPPDVTIDGRSMLPVINDPKAPSAHKVLHWQWQNRWAVREGDWKLLGRGNKGTELVSLAGEDPERTNFLKKQPEIAERLMRHRRAWAEQVTPR